MAITHCVLCSGSNLSDLTCNCTYILKLSNQIACTCGQRRNNKEAMQIHLTQFVTMKSSES